MPLEINKYNVVFMYLRALNGYPRRKHSMGTPLLTLQFIVHLSISLINRNSKAHQVFNVFIICSTFSQLKLKWLKNILILECFLRIMSEI